ncbi:Ig-like domain-containing protein [Clostridium lacusfryxellense]|uniref:Ig-like domain-containing protein n=1 Tax=Clostridium lacusfryxellense TaxID=205328 RepID=UPI001C0C167E|nr:Ig-like domain-containing protein [Clostridium lacusfryxellense]MBU3112122.1 Ig-like domain-containing protein [Clostridium lacusfryxellense]
MFLNTKIKVLGDNPNNTGKSILVDVQEYNQDVKLKNYSISGYKRLYLEIEPSVKEGTYLKVDDEILQVVKIIRYRDCMEVFVSEVEAIKINNIAKSIIFEDSSDKYIDYKTILSNQLLTIGDMSDYQGLKWLTIGEISKSGTFSKGTMRKCRPITYSGITLYGIVESRVYDVVDDGFNPVVDKEIIVTVNNKTYIPLSSSIIFHNAEYKVMAINDAIENMVSLRCELILPTYTFRITLNTPPTTSYTGNTFQIVPTCNDGAIDVINPVVTYTSTNEDIAAVDNNGLVTMVASGTVNINATYENVGATMNFNISDVIVNKPVIMNGSDELYTTSGNVQDYSVSYDDSSAIENDSYTWTIDDLSLAVFVGTPTGTSCQLKTKTTSSNGWFVLTATSNTDGSFLYMDIDARNYGM